MRAARAWIRTGVLARVVALRTILVGGLSERVAWQRRRAQGGGAIYELGSHHFDLWRFLLDTEATDVRAHSLFERIGRLDPYSRASQLIINMAYAFYNADPADARFFTTNNLALRAQLVSRVRGI